MYWVFKIPGQSITEKLLDSDVSSSESLKFSIVLAGRHGSGVGGCIMICGITLPSLVLDCDSVINLDKGAKVGWKCRVCSAIFSSWSSGLVFPNSFCATGS